MARRVAVMQMFRIMSQPGTLAAQSRDGLSLVVSSPIEGSFWFLVLCFVCAGVRQRLAEWLSPDLLRESWLARAVVTPVGKSLSILPSRWIFASSSVCHLLFRCCLFPFSMPLRSLRVIVAFRPSPLFPLSASAFVSFLHS